MVVLSYENSQPWIVPTTEVLIEVLKNSGTEIFRCDFSGTKGLRHEDS